MRTETMMVTPAKASEWLKRNTDNRAMRRSTVEGLADAIRRGEWKLSHQGIAFSDSGRLLDGQHRLAAIVEAGISVPMSVTWDCDESTFDVLDIGAKRSLSDILHVAADDAAIARFMVILTDTAKQRAITPQLVAPYLAAFQPYIRDLLDFCPKRTKAWGSAAVRAAAVLKLADGEDADYVKLQYYALNHTETETLSPVAAVLLKQYMDGKLRAGNYDMLARALKVFTRSNAHMRTLVVASTEAALQYSRGIISGVMSGEKKPRRKAGAGKGSARSNQTDLLTDPR